MERLQGVDVELPLDRFDRAFRQHTEHETYAFLRAHQPVAWSPTVDEWWLTSYGDCRSAFQDHETFANDLRDEGSGERADQRLSGIPQNVDPPAHRAYRRLLDPFFSSSAVDALEADIRQHADSLIDRIVARGECDFVEDFAHPFPSHIFLRMMGLPSSDHSMVSRWNDIYMNVREVSNADAAEPGAGAARVEENQRAAGEELAAYLESVIDRRRKEPGGDLISQLVASRYEDERPLTHDELVRIAFNLMLGGLDTVSGVLSFIVWDFAERPDRRDAFVAVMDDDGRVRLAIEELLRFHAVVTIPRRVRRGCTVQDHELHEGDIAQLVTPSACRDATRFDEPDNVDFGRSPNHHLAFGLGHHRCLGIHLARTELRVGLQQFHRRIAEYGVKSGEAPRIGLGMVRGVDALPLVVTGRR